VGNVAPRGLFGRSGTTWKPPAAVYARDAGVWKKAKFVYCYDAANNKWQLIWGSLPAAPASATAVWRSPHSVRITITHPAVNSSNSWIVRRSDGSIAATAPVAVGATTIVDDLTPLLSSTVTGNKTLAAYTVEGSDGTVSSAKVSTGTVTWNLDPATVTTAVSYPTATTATVKVSWTPNATYGDPDGWKVWRSDGTWFPTSGVLPGSTRSYDVANQARGVALGFRAVPFTLNAAGAYVQAGNGSTITANSKAVTPVSLSLTAPTTSVNTLRLSWNTGGGTITGYEVQTSTNGTTWAASADDVSPSDWTTTVTGYMRVRALSAGGASDWAQAGPKTPVIDTTPPADAAINALKPEASYGRLVLRFTTPGDADFNGYRVKWKYGLTGAVTNGAWVTANRNTAYGVVVGTFDAGDNVYAGVDVKDDAGNINTGGFAAYLLAASPIVIDPSGDKSGTYAEGVGWRNDAVRALTEIATGYTYPHRNIGCFFYGTQLFDRLSENAASYGRTFTSGHTIEIYRENEGGLTTAVVPRFQTHALTGRSGAPAVGGSGASESQLLGPSMIRSTPVDTSVYTLPATWFDAFRSGTSKGIGFYRGDIGSGGPPWSTGETDSYYMQLGIGGASATAGVINGRLRFNHLG
jgi:hypothetical protein